MCGILGRISNKPANDAFSKGLNSMAHRGPDGYGIWQEGKISLGHRRLSIIDLTENGKQPMQWADRYVITFNGEIYNYIELREELEKKGVYCKSQSDTEVLLTLYANEGPSCLNKLNGMWAFAIYDKQEQVLFLSRDRMGKKPLFYVLDNEQFAFASEMKALYAFLQKVEPNTEVMEMAKNNAFSYESTDKCIIKGVKRFPAASFAYYQFGGELKPQIFWKPLDSLVKVPKSYEEQVQQFRELFIDACKIRMRSDVTVGTALSGGIDSSATISTMAYVAKHLQGTYSRDWQHAYVASFPGTFLDETKEASIVANHLGINATYLKIDPLKDIDKIFYYSYLFEDFYITSPIPFIQLYGQVKQNGTTVTLDGHGSDELFGGYPFDLHPKLADDYPNPIRMLQTKQTIEDARLNGQKLGFRSVYTEYLTFSKSKIKQLLLNSNQGKPADTRLDFLNNQLYQSSFKTILPTLLRNYDRYSMINGVEIRMPFLDHRLVSFAFSIPSSSKVRNGYTKAIVRDAMKDFFPDNIRLLKRKIGFNSPFTEWLKGPLKEWIRDELASRAFQQATFIEPQKVETFIESVISNDKATFHDGELAWISLMPFIWEKSLAYANA